MPILKSEGKERDEQVVVEEVLELELDADGKGN